MAVGEPANGYTAVAGLGATGLACARHLLRRGEAVAVTDSRREPPGLAALRREHPQVPVAVGGLDREALLGAERVVVSPGLDLRSGVLAELRAAGREVVGELTLFAAAARAPVLAVTGSNGKSTAVSLLAEMARHAGIPAAVGGNLGTPALELLERGPVACYILEVSSFQLEACPGFRPQAGAVLNVSADHMDRYADLDSYAAAKARLLEGAAVAVVNADDPYTAAMGAGAGARRAFSLEQPAAAYRLLRRAGAEYLAAGDEPRMPVAELAVPGRSYCANALAAMALADAYGIPAAAQRSALASFPGLPHRMERLGEWGGVAWLNDSKATNVGAALAALQGLERPVVLIAGGQGKGADFRPLADACAERARAVVLIGEDAPQIEAALGGRVPVVRAAGMGEAVAAAAARARRGDAVVLAPACASFDAFSGFEQRGEAFRQAVREEVGDG
ncbi:UDP-N-acetylmuramoyl-L-alanine--D-glutamate ligase [Halorhodospira neutriphila]|uniref:UDP-N-acetylmuramoylalanine--D-glutamate ligase n=1 Tax=Halorhodospira neutriphila TaxID=168379 RepID=A0ABS1E9M1_9GAMM|nr:UDP-N-acetylmuramoyl-L-alanine--D-glutamate ligase [Halorhodospira neutriphila]MBK1727379.1 UDP-N-acetylmuramoyl-L-alanine--D-glutamate ligase [Halorhodospira neutriphila]